MRPPFPGMDPWLEDPTLWPDVHGSLITAIRDALIPQIAPRYFAGVESRTTILSSRDVDRVYRPDVSVHAMDSGTESRGPVVAVLEQTDVQTLTVAVPGAEETEETFLAIRDVPGRKLVTVIEVLSPTNKKTEDARGQYLKKREDLIYARVNLVEIDLLRGGEPMPLKPAAPLTDYRILVCRARRSKDAVLYAFPYTSPVPPIPIPLLPGDREPELDLNSVLHALIERARYDLIIDYNRPPDPALRPADDAWAKSIVAPAIANRARETQSEGVTA
jgi:Protein of unknown function (DUF4058)